jgi:hypothetical protein
MIAHPRDLHDRRTADAGDDLSAGGVAAQADFGVEAVKPGAVNSDNREHMSVRWRRVLRHQLTLAARTESDTADQGEQTRGVDCTDGVRHLTRTR